MELLLFSDLHRDVAAAERIAARSGDADVLIGAGDFATTRRGLGDTLDVLREIPRPVVLVPGNSETTAELRDACRDWPQAHVLHGSGVRIAGIRFWGLGGAVPMTPFGDWSYDFSEDQAAQLLAACPSDGVLVSHSPPQGVLDRSSSGQSLGSTSVREAVERCRPRLVVCGHIHACGGQSAVIGTTTVINAGPEGIRWTLSTTSDCDGRTASGPA